jgi:hypothetical protein
VWSEGRVSSDRREDGKQQRKMKITEKNAKKKEQHKIKEIKRDDQGIKEGTIQMSEVMLTERMSKGKAK